MGTNIITPQFIEKMRSSDYQGTSYAFAELIDNSFDEDATKVKVICIEKRDHHNRRFIDEILTCDNGNGMIDTVLDNCLTFAYGTNNDVAVNVSKRKIGKFGMGLPNASISQCKSVTVYSKTAVSEWRTKRLDIKELIDNDSTELFDFETTELPKYYEQVGAILDGGSKGTIVSWRHCDLLDRQYADTLFRRAEGILGRLFRYYLDRGCTIELVAYLLNVEDGSYIETTPSRMVVLNDPLFLTPNAYITKVLKAESTRDESIEDPKLDPATHYAKFIAGLPPGESRPTSEKLEDQSYIHRFEWGGKEYNFTFKTSFAHMGIQKPGIREGGRTKVGSVYGEKMKVGNIYFTRHDREIALGHFGLYAITAENNRWWGIEIGFDADADELMGVSNTKQGIKFTKTIEEDPTIIFDPHTSSLQQARERLWFELTKKLDKAVKAVTKKVREQADDFERIINQAEGGEIQVPTGTQQTTLAIKKTDRQRSGSFDNDQKKDFISALQSKFKTLTEEEAVHAVDRFDRALVRGCIIYCPIDDSTQLWSYSEIRGFLVIYINTNHDFYKNIMAAFRNISKFESALTAIELFISSLAWEQNEHFDIDPDKKRNLDNFRTFVGVHLSNYLQENDIKINQEELEELVGPATT